MRRLTTFENNAAKIIGRCPADDIIELSMLSLDDLHDFEYYLLIKNVLRDNTFNL
jgi:hypothetical protein